jgi:NAD(P)H-dependent flavin oxidoreductase YrpB (nitropropane dioxygenase family)
MFNSQYPIVSLAMNQVSDFELAYHVAAAGGIPCVSYYNYTESVEEIGEKDRITHNFARELLKFKQRLAQENLPNNLILSFGANQLLHGRYSSILQLLILGEIKYIELILEGKIDQTIFIEALDIIRESGVEIILKTVVSPGDLTVALRLKKWISAIGLKGPDGAGRVSGSETLEERILRFQGMQKEAGTDIKIIACGGIATKADVDRFLEMGCVAVGAGTLFAVSEESCIHPETKLKMLGASAEDIKQLQVQPGGDNTQMDQNGLVFTEEGRDRWNNTAGLKMAVAEGPTHGHVFAGRGIGKIKMIKPVKQIIEELFNV